MSWLTRSKALLRSKNTDPISLLLSIPFSHLSVRLNQAVSQEWPGRYADCLLYRRPNYNQLHEKKKPFILQIAASHRSMRYNTDLPPIQSCSSKFWAWSCIASNSDKGWTGVTSTRSWTGHLSQNTVQCLKYFCNWL